MLELYSEKDKNYLKSEINLPCWSLFNIDKIGGGGGGGGVNDNDSNITFSNNDNSYSDLMNMDLTGEAPKKLSLIKKEEEERGEGGEGEEGEGANEEINIDDI